jgi:FlaA1/EpsC-like NDP-sugar epimerase
MSRGQRIALFIVIDSCIVLIAVAAGWSLIHTKASFLQPPPIVGLFTILLSHHLFSVRYKFYKKAWEYASVGELLIIIKVSSYSIIAAFAVQFILLQELHFRFLAISWLLHLLLIGGSRFMWRMYRDTMINKQGRDARTLIVGAGSAGTMVARQLLKNNTGTLYPVAFIDDNKGKQNLDILGIPVAGGVREIPHIVEKLAVDNIIIAIPSLKKKDLNVIFQECAKTKARTKILPLLEDLVTGKLSVNQFREVEVEDLLGRDPVDMDTKSISAYITDKIVLVTGAGGSIGSEIARQIAQFRPKQLILLGHGENSIYTIEMQLKEILPNNEIEFITEIADVKDAWKMMMVMETYKPDVVYHAAAHKHVPLMERNPEQAVANNIIGTMNVAKAASWYNVNTFVMISTDKAVNPTSVMGASKKLAEMLIQDMDMKSETKFVTVRFGNVLGSRGSVIPLFKKQIAQGGPVTVTHPDMVRFFMTIPEASRLVIQSGALAKGGEVFVLDMGEPVKIVDLAKNLIKLSGYSINEIGLAFTGIRPGEKLYEELLQKNEIHEKQLYPKIYIGKTTELYINEIEEIINTYTGLDRDTLRIVLLDLANHRVAEQPKSAVII